MSWQLLSYLVFGKVWNAVIGKNRNRSNFHCCKWANIENIINPSGHTGGRDRHSSSSKKILPPKCLTKRIIWPKKTLGVFGPQKSTKFFCDYHPVAPGLTKSENTLLFGGTETN